MQWDYSSLPAPRGHILLLVLTVLPTVVHIPYELSIVLHAALIVYVSSWRSIVEEAPQESMSQKDALKFPVVGSCVLFGLFVCLKFLPKELVNMAIAGYITLVGAFAVVSALAPPVRQLLPERLRHKRFHVLTIPRIPLLSSDPTTVDPDAAELLVFPPAVGLGVWYLLTKHWLANNALGICFSVAGIEALSLGSVQTAAILLSGLFFYDIFWVFCTPVMVSVARDLEAPIKLMFRRAAYDPSSPKNFAILGLGDIVIPGLFIALMCRYDFGQNFNTKYFPTVFWSYVGGVAGTIAVMNFFKAAQPALLYIVPAVLGSVLLHAALRGELSKVWHWKEHTLEEAEQAVAAAEGEAEGVEGKKVQ